MFLLGLLILPALTAADSAVLTVLRSSALAGDLRPVALLVDESEREPSVDNLDQLSEVLLQQYRERFVSMTELPHTRSDAAPDKLSSQHEESALAELAIAAYRHYWRAVLTRSIPVDQADRELQTTIGELLDRHYSRPGAVSVPATCDDRPDPSSGINVFHCLEQALGELGLGSNAGITPPWRDLYIWTGQHISNYEVELTDRIEQVKVTFIEQPLVQGWQHYASLDLITTSGWATAEGLFCLCWSYDLDSSAFKVSWLKHETRHSVDLKTFPGIDEARLEYRAKLTELTFSGQEVSSLLRQFSESGSADGESVHAQANYRVSRDIYRQIFQQDPPADKDPWQLVGSGHIARAARDLLQQDTDHLKETAQLN